MGIKISEDSSRDQICPLSLKAVMKNAKIQKGRIKENKSGMLCDKDNSGFDNGNYVDG